MAFSLRLICPQCQARFAVSGLYAGKVVRCKTCSTLLNVPSSEPAPSQAPDDWLPDTPTRPTLKPARSQLSPRLTQALVVALFITGFLLFAEWVTHAGTANPQQHAGSKDRGFRTPSPESAQFNPQDYEESKRWFFGLMREYQNALDLDNELAGQSAKDKLAKQLVSVTGKEVEWDLPVAKITQDRVVMYTNNEAEHREWRGESRPRAWRDVFDDPGKYPSYLVIALLPGNSTQKPFGRWSNIGGYNSDKENERWVSLKIGSQISHEHALRLKSGSTVKVKGRIYCARLALMGVPHLTLNQVAAVDY